VSAVIGAAGCEEFLYDIKGTASRLAALGPAGLPLTEPRRRR